VAAMLACAKAGADAVDAALDSMSGTTSQPSAGALLASQDDDVQFNVRHEDLTAMSNYWEVRCCCCCCAFCMCFLMCRIQHRLFVVNTRRLKLQLLCEVSIQVLFNIKFP
jgi:hypothetical protein